MSDSPFVGAALAYAGRGWHVFPLVPGTKDKPKVKWGERASCDERAVLAMFADRDNVAIATGTRSGLLVFDVDLYKPSGAESLKKLVEEHGTAWLDTAYVDTPRGGRHYFYSLDAPAGSQNDRWPGIDVKADGGYVVAAPSSLPGVGRYKWKDERPVAPAPDWMRIAPRKADGSGLRHGMIEASEELRLAVEADMFIRWDADHGEPQGKALVRCPAWRKHQNENKDTDAMLYVGDKGGVRFTCYHGSCKKDQPTTLAFMDECRRLIEEQAPEPEDDEIPEGFRFRPISQLERTSLDEWLWEGFVAPALVTILHSEPKVGKTTLLTDLYRAFGDGGTYCGQPVAQCNVFVITEEGTDNWADRRDEKDLQDHIFLCTQPPVGHADWDAWGKLMEWTRKQAIKHEARCVVLDTSSGLWPVVSEYDNSEIARAVKATQCLTQAGMAVVFSSHSRKAEGSQISSLRGGSALAGAADIVVQMSRVKNDPESVKRMLIPSGRRPETPAKLIVAYGVDGYEQSAKIESVDIQEKVHWLLAQIPYEPEGIVTSRLKEACRGHLSHTRMQKLLDRLLAGGELVRLEDGKWPRWARRTA